MIVLSQKSTTSANLLLRILQQLLYYFTGIKGTYTINTMTYIQFCINANILLKVCEIITLWYEVTPITLYEGKQVNSF